MKKLFHNFIISEFSNFWKNWTQRPANFRKKLTLVKMSIFSFFKNKNNGFIESIFRKTKESRAESAADLGSLNWAVSSTRWKTGKEQNKNFVKGLFLNFRSKAAFDATSSKPVTFFVTTDVEVPFEVGQPSPRDFKRQG